MALFIYIERYLTIRKAHTDAREFMEQVRQHILTGSIEAALVMAIVADNIGKIVILTERSSGIR